MRKWLLTVLLVVSLRWGASPVWAGMGWGIHILHPEEINLVTQYRGNSDEFYVTVPLSIYERNTEVWKTFFETAEKQRITPIVRWTTRFEFGSWQRPNRKDIVDAAAFLRTLPWKGPRYLIVFNEPNHAAEWGGSVDPWHYAETYVFAAAWLKTEREQYIVMPAALDAAAPNGKETMDSFAFINGMLAKRPDMVEFIDAWASHAYPNPGFVGSAYDVGKRSIRGFESELALLSQYGLHDVPIYITETGWRQTKQTVWRLPAYYRYAAEHVWSHPQVKAVTVFLLQGSYGPFAEFSLLNPEGTPSPQFDALQQVMGSVVEE